MRTRRISAAKNDAFKLARNGRILWRDEEIAKLEPGEHPLKPQLVLIADEHLQAPDKEKIQERLTTWLNDTIRERLGVLTTKGYVKFFRDHDAYGLPPATRSKFGYLCVEGMHLGPAEESVDPNTGEITTTAQWVLPTHYKCPQSGAVLPVENPQTWVYLDDGEAVG